MSADPSAEVAEEDLLADPRMEAAALPLLPEGEGADAPGAGEMIVPGLLGRDDPLEDPGRLLPAGNLPLEEPWIDDPGGNADLFAGERDAFADLDSGAAPGPLGLGRPARDLEAFDAGILQSELLSSVFQLPLERQGFRFGMGGQVNYDSNLYLDDVNEQSDFSFVFTPSIEFRSAPAGVPGLVTFRYTPFVRRYFEETDLNTVDHSANAAVSFAGARGNFQVSADYGRFSHADQNLGGRRETETFYVTANAVYLLASRTSLEGNFFGRASTDTDLDPTNTGPARSNDDESLQLQLAAYWQATSKTRIGPSVRYSKSSSDSIGDRDSLALLVVAAYAPRDELSLYASAGMERVSSEQGVNIKDQDSTDFTGSFGFIYRPGDRIALGADLSYQAIPAGSNRASRSGGGEQSLTGGITLTYIPNEDWSLAVGFNADAYPAADSTNYSIGDQTYTATLTRHLAEGSLSLIGSLSFADYEPVGYAITTRADEDRRSIALRYERPVFANRGQFHASVQWSDYSGPRSWQRFQTTVGVVFEF